MEIDSTNVGIKHLSSKRRETSSDLPQTGLFRSSVGLWGGFDARSQFLFDEENTECEKERSDDEEIDEEPMPRGWNL